MLQNKLQHLEVNTNILEVNTNTLELKLSQY